jgi:hypothetical protein
MIPRVSGVAFVVFAALAVHAAGGLEDILRVQAAERNDTVSGVHRPVLRPAYRPLCGL